MSEKIKSKAPLKEWSIKLRVSTDEQQKIKMRAIEMSMGIASYIKQAALDGNLDDKKDSQKLKKNN